MWAYLDLKNVGSYTIVHRREPGRYWMRSSCYGSPSHCFCEVLQGFPIIDFLNWSYVFDANNCTRGESQLKSSWARQKEWKKIFDWTRDLVRDQDSDATTNVIYSCVSLQWPWLSILTMALAWVLWCNVCWPWVHRALLVLASQVLGDSHVPASSGFLNHVCFSSSQLLHWI